jgi:hypothetical protein
LNDLQIEDLLTLGIFYQQNSWILDDNFMQL